MQKKKILYVITKSDPWGGAQKYVFDLATHLPKNTFDVAVALGGNGPLKQKLDEAGIRTVTVSSFQRDIHLAKEIGAMIELHNILKKEQPDIVHLNSSKAGGLGALVARMNNINKIVFTSHGLAFEEDRSWFTQAVIQFFSWLTFLLAHNIILISKANLRRVARMPFVKQKLSRIYNAVDTIAYKEKKEARRKLADRARIPKEKHSADTTWIGTIAELHKNKGLVYLLEAVKTIISKKKDIVLIIVGEGEMHETFEILINKRNLSGHVFLTGYITDAAEYVKAFDIFVLPSVKEGHPYTLIEAGLAGVPTVGTAIPGIEDVIDDMESGMLVKPKNAIEMQEAILYLLANSEKRALFGGELRARITERFSMKKMLTQTQEIYRA